MLPLMSVVLILRKFPPLPCSPSGLRLFSRVILISVVTTVQEPMVPKLFRQDGTGEDFIRSKGDTFSNTLIVSLAEVTEGLK